MNAIVSFATAASVLVHALFGCCAHHAHDGLAACCTGQTVEEAAQPKKSACCKHAHKHLRSAQPQAMARHDSQPAPLPPSPCQQGRCTAVLAGKSESAGPVVTLGLPLVCSLEHLTPDGNATIRPDYASQQHHLGPPLRPHLCNLVLLI